VAEARRIQLVSKSLNYYDLAIVLGIVFPLLWVPDGFDHFVPTAPAFQSNSSPDSDCARYLTYHLMSSSGPSAMILSIYDINPRVGRGRSDQTNVAFVSIARVVLSPSPGKPGKDRGRIGSWRMPAGQVQGPGYFELGCVFHGAEFNRQ
jgi:hypothetical protein